MRINTERLCLAQAKACLSGKDIQSLTQLSDVALTRIRRGQQNPRPATVGKLAKALNVSVEYLIGLDEEGGKR